MTILLLKNPRGRTSFSDFAETQHPLRSPDNGLVRVRLEAVCHDCRHRHLIDVVPDHFGRAAFDWEVKHRGHSIEFLTPSRFVPKGFDDRPFERAGKAPWWLDYKHNDDLKIAYAADGQFTITLASLATSSTWTTGRQTTSVSNTTNKYLDYDIAGKLTTGSSTPTADTEFRVYAIKPINDTPTWPSVSTGFGSSDASAVFHNSQQLAAMPLLWAGTVAATASRGYPIISALTLAQIWGVVPDNFLLYVAHNTGVNMSSTGSDHELSYRGIYATSI